jgi:hypothetical protein
MKSSKSLKILAWALIGMALAKELDQWLNGRLFVLPPTILALISLLVAVMVITIKKRWVPIVPILYSALNLFTVFNSSFEIYHLSHPFTRPFFVAVISIIAMLGTFIAALYAIISNYKSK